MLNTHQTFHFKEFSIHQDRCQMKVNTDGVLLGAWSNTTDKKLILDIGTGTGVIALMMAQKTTNSTIIGVEIDPVACQQASENIENSRFCDRVQCISTSIQEFSNISDLRFDLIITNPPFFSGGTFSSNENRANVRHTIKLSHTDLLMSVKKLLSHDGHFDIILPYIEGLRFIEMAGAYDLYLLNQTNLITRPENGIERLLMRFGKFPQNCEENTLTAQLKHHQVNEYTDEYQALVKPFYTFL